MENPNEYDDDLFSQASNDLFEAIGGLWEAGATEDEIRSQVDNALKQL